MNDMDQRLVAKFAGLAVAGLMMGSASASAQGIYSPEPVAESSVEDAEPDLIFELGAGILVRPRYEGAKDVLFSPWPIFSLQYLSVGNRFTIDGRTPKNGFSIRPAFSVIDERDADDDADLTGLNRIDTAVELGARAGYRYNAITGYLELRFGVTGHHGIVGEVGFDYEIVPNDRWTLKIGPHATFADDEYVDTYFGVTALEAARSTAGLRAFDPDAGFKSVGIHGSAKYEFADNWFLNARASYDRLVGDADDSPVVNVGTEDQFTAGLGISRRFSIRFGR